MSGAQGTHRRSTPPEAGIDARAALQRPYRLGPHDTEGEAARLPGEIPWRVPCYVYRPDKPEEEASRQRGSGTTRSLERVTARRDGRYAGIG